MKQYVQVIDAIRQNGGFATLGQLYRTVNTKDWGTKTPLATIRRIVQQREEIFKIRPGLWALEDYKDSLPEHIFPKDLPLLVKEEFGHSYYQGLLVEIGNMRRFETYIPNQDKNKPYMNGKLTDIATTQEFYDFSYDNLIRYARTIDVVWFNSRKMPNSFFEVEHSTDIKNSLLKFVELQDFYTNFSIVADIKRKRHFEDIVKMTAFEAIRSRVKFIDYERVSNLYEATLREVEFRRGF